MMRRVWPAISAVVLVAAVAGAYMLGIGQREPAPMASPTSISTPVATSSAPTAPSTETQTPTVEYHVRRVDGKPTTTALLGNVTLAERYIRGMYERDYSLPRPGFAPARILTTSIGEAHTAAAETIANAPDDATYSSSRGYWKRVTISEVTARSDQELVFTLTTLDSADVTTEVNLLLTTTTCRTNPAGICVATFEPFTTE